MAKLIHGNYTPFLKDKKNTSETLNIAVLVEVCYRLTVSKM